MDEVQRSATAAGWLEVCVVFEKRLGYREERMPREIITVQLGQCGNQSKFDTVIYAEFEEIMREREGEGWEERD